ncbi:hypothetical protein CW304_13545 [Bacillus sp. UFRGS-B20]|nr:hypothetical protein CW304_13545 [Bacillus sp. UFRGS-B20]
MFLTFTYNVFGKSIRLSILISIFACSTVFHKSRSIKLMVVLFGPQRELSFASFPRVYTQFVSLLNR